MVFILFKFVPCPLPFSSLGNRTTVCCTHPCPWSSASPWVAVAGVGGNSWWLSLPLVLWGHSAFLHDCGSRCEMLWPSWPLPPSWMGLSLLGAVLGIFPYPDQSLEGQLWSVAGSWHAEAGAPGVAQEGRICGEPDAASSRTNSPAAIPACPTAQPCPHCPQWLV